MPPSPLLVRISRHPGSRNHAVLDTEDYRRDGSVLLQPVPESFCDHIPIPLADLLDELQSEYRAPRASLQLKCGLTKG